MYLDCISYIVSHKNTKEDRNVVLFTKLVRVIEKHYLVMFAQNTLLCFYLGTGTVTACGGDLKRNIMKFPSHGNTYGNNMECNWTITRKYPFILRFKQFDLEQCPLCRCDYVRVGGDEKKCGTRFPDNAIVNNSIQLLFQSDNKINRRGFEVDIIKLMDERGKLFVLLNQKLYFTLEYA